ncbi:heterokaryon incompatibility protein-domain-containing protein [Xylariaceae sp. FL1651]|nr:heterokaryon incompatibility protein-domain-containing protein [Xylariaceae sp. FL1651]
MANRSIEETNRTATIASMERTQGLLREKLASGNVPVDEEVRLRSLTADVFIQTYDQLRHPPFIHDAVHHIEAILRHIPREADEYHIHLTSLSKARTSEYMIVGSRHALDLAIEAGREALELARNNDPEGFDSKSYMDTISTLGYALSRRHAVSANLDDLDEAIVYSRIVYEGASKGSDQYVMGLNNLVSQMRRKVEQTHDDGLEKEVRILLKELVSSTTPGTLQNSIAVGQLGVMDFNIFKVTNSLEDLDQALRHCKIALEALPQNHETRLDLLTVMVELLSVRRSQMKEVTDLERLIHYSELFLEALSTEHCSWGSHFLEHTLRVKEYAIEVSSPQAFGNAITQIQRFFSTMPAVSPQKMKCEVVLSDILGMRYKLSTELRDLIALANQVAGMVFARNREIQYPGSVERPVQENWIWAMQKDLSLVSAASIDNEMRILVEQELAGIFTSKLEPQKAAIPALAELYQNYGARLRVIADAIQAHRVLSEEHICLLTEGVKNKRVGSAEASTKRTGFRTKEYENELGLRKLAVDSETGDIILEFNEAIMKETLGYDTSEPSMLSKEAFIIRESRLEQRAIEKARAEGRHPNLHLCRMCRDVARPLQPTPKGFQLTTKNICLPFGNFHQLYCRKHCIICRLILSRITTDTEALHPQLEAIDREVQGTRLATGTLSAGEKIIRIEYGMQYVGEVRIISPQNYHRTVRQAWEADSQCSLDEVLTSRSGPVLSPLGQQINPALIQYWMSDCDHNHSADCNSNRLHTSGAEHMSMLFIDVIENCLVSASSREKYFALSYVWGKVDMAKTTKSNYLTRLRPSALSSIPFPRTIRDAMQLVKSIGGRLLWVDAICLIQDDEEEMARDIPRMNIVYGRAFATLIALHGDNADAGLPGVSPGTRRPQHIESLRVSSGHLQLDYDAQYDKNETIYLMATPPPLNLALNISKWNARGWVFQERLLSRRCLYFSEQAVYFQCAQHTLSEFGTNEEYTASLLDSEVPMKPKLSSVKAARDNPLDLIHSIQDMTAAEQLCKAFIIYKDTVRSYSRREFSFKSDAINGFLGVFAVLEKYFRSETYGGLPGAVLVHALLWTPAGRLPRRGMRLPTVSDFLSMGKPDSQFPSWSWAGWDGPVEYRLFNEVNGKLQLPIPMFDRYCIGNRITVINDGHIATQTGSDATRGTSEDLGVPEATSKQTDNIMAGGIVGKGTERLSVKKSAFTESADKSGTLAGNTSSLLEESTVLLSENEMLSSRGSAAKQVDTNGKDLDENGLREVHNFPQMAVPVNVPRQSMPSRDINSSVDPSRDNQPSSSSLSPPKGKGVSIGDPGREGSYQESPPERTQQGSIKIRILPDYSRATSWMIGGPAPMEPWDPPRDDNILSFRAPTVSCCQFVISQEKEYLIELPYIHQQGSQAVRRILDGQGKHCGLWWEQAGYGYVGLGLDAEAEKQIQLVGVSAYGDVYHRHEGPARVKGEIELFDRDVFPEVGPGSGLVNVLAVDTDLSDKTAVGYRCTVAVIHAKAWSAAKPQQTDWRLA